MLYCGEKWNKDILFTLFFFSPLYKCCAQMCPLLQCKSQQ